MIWLAIPLVLLSILSFMMARWVNRDFTSVIFISWLNGYAALGMAVLIVVTELVLA
jgi:hypothetical protein